MIGIIDYGMGNLHSVKNALDNLYIDSRIIDEAGELSNFGSVILPGVGSFNRAMSNLDEGGWTDAIIKFSENKPVLGICLGMQLMFSSSDEGGHSKGLNLFSGKVQKISDQNNLKLPHVGWNDLIIKKDCSLLNGINQEIDVYFVHSYECIPDNKSDISSEVNYGKNIVASVSKGLIFGLQFHPEKSQPSGLKMLENFYNLSK